MSVEWFERAHEHFVELLKDPTKSPKVREAYINTLNFIDEILEDIKNDEHP